MTEFLLCIPFLYTYEDKRDTSEIPYCKLNPMSGGPNMQKLSTGAAYQFTPADNYAPSMGQLPAVLIVHGWKATVFTGHTYFGLALKLQAAGYHTLQLSLRAHQGSDGDITSVTRAEHLSDIQSAIDYLAQRPEVDTKRLCAFGTSYGAYLLAFKPEEFKLLALRAPALYPDSNWEEPTAILVQWPDLKEWRAEKRLSEESRALQGISGFGGDLLVVGSELDEDMPPQVLQSYAQAAAQAKSYQEHIILGATHSLAKREYQEEFFAVAGQWFIDHYPR